MYTVQEQFNNLSNYGETYTATDTHNGKTCKKGAQILTVIAAYSITHGKNFPNHDIVAVALVEGKRNARYSAYVYRSGNVQVI